MLDSVFAEIVFWTLTVITVGSALLLVHVQSVFRAALLLVVTFIGMAGYFAMINAEFLAVIQVLIYGGGIAVLIIFAVMLTRDVSQGNRATHVQPVAFLVAVMLAGALIFSATQAEWAALEPDLSAPLAEIFVDTTSRLGQVLLGEFVLAFEIVGVVLLAAVVGALGLVRGR